MSGNLLRSGISLASSTDDVSSEAKRYRVCRIGVFAPRSKRYYHSGSIVLRAEVHGLISEPLHSLLWIFTSADNIYHFLVVYHVVNSVRWQDQECILTMLHLRKWITIELLFFVWGYFHLSLSNLFIEVLVNIIFKQVALTLMWPLPWCVTLTVLMTYSHIQRINMLK